jgi:hypothetical protein
MGWVQILTIVLQLAGAIARRLERADIEKAVLNEVEILHGRRLRAAETARDDVLSGRMPERPDDPYRRD